MKRRFVAFLVLCSIVFGCTSCGKSNSISSSVPLETPFKTISQENCTVYDVNTRTVYYLFSTDAMGGYSYGYMAPYIQNGHYCEYIDGKIIEVTN